MLISSYIQIVLICGYFLYLVLVEGKKDSNIMSIDSIKALITQKADILFVISELGKKINSSDFLEELNSGSAESLDLGKDISLIKLGENSSDIKIQKDLNIKPKEIIFGRYKLCIEGNGNLTFSEEGYPKISLDSLKTSLVDIENNIVRNRNVVYTLDNYVRENYYSKDDVYNKLEISQDFVTKNDFEDSLSESLGNIQIENEGYTKSETQLIFYTREELNDNFLSKEEANSKYKTFEEMNSLYSFKENVYTKTMSDNIFQKKQDTVSQVDIDNSIQEALIIGSTIYETKNNIAQNYVSKVGLDSLNYVSSEDIITLFNFVSRIELDSLNFVSMENISSLNFVTQVELDSLNLVNTQTLDVVDTKTQNIQLNLSTNYYTKFNVDQAIQNVVDEIPTDYARKIDLLTDITEENGDLNIHADIIPSTSEIYNLGNPQKRFKDLYLSGSTIHLGTQTISTDTTTGSIKINNLVIGGDTNNIRLSVNIDDPSKPTLRVSALDENNIEQDAIIENSYLSAIESKIINVETNIESLTGDVSTLNTRLIEITTQIVEPTSITTTGVLKTNSGAISTSVTTGALIVSGGAGIAKDVYMGEGLFVNSNINLTGTGNIFPVTGNIDSNLGSSTQRWNNIYSNNSVSSNSDIRLKKDIESLNNNDMVEFINLLNPVKYKMINGTSDRFHCGLIAQEVKTVMPFDWGVYTEGDGNIGLRYEELISPMIKYIQVLEKRISDLEEIVNLSSK